MINQVPVNIISADEIFMTQMKVVYFLMQTTLAGCLLCIIFKMTVLGVVSLQLFLLFFYQGNILRVEFCRRHCVMRTRGEMVLWKISLLIIVLLFAFIIFNLLFTLVIVLFGNFESQDLYWQSIINIFNKKKLEITISIQILSLFIQSVVIYLFFFRRQMELIIYKYETILDKYIIQDLSIIPIDRVECIICLDEMRQCSNKDGIQQSQIQIKNKNSIKKQQIINQNVDISKHHICCQSPFLRSIQNSIKKCQNENIYQFNQIKVDDIKDKECIIQNNSCNEENDCKLEEDNAQIPNLNILALQKILTLNGTQKIDGFKSLILFKDNQLYENDCVQAIQSCQQIDSKNENQKQIFKKRHSQQKLTLTEGEKSTQCDSQTYCLQSQQSHYLQQDELQQNNITPSFKGEGGLNLESEIQKNIKDIENKVQNNQIQPYNKVDTQQQAHFIKNSQNSNQISQQQSKLDLQNRNFSNNNQQEANDNDQNHVLLITELNNNQQNDQTEQNQEKLIVGFKCKHYFHYDCMRQWLKTSQNLRCPTCRQNSML